MIAFQLLEHWNTMTNEEIYRETLISLFLCNIGIKCIYK